MIDLRQYTLLILLLISVGSCVKKAKFNSNKRQAVASWYGQYFHGRTTANGEIYDMYALTAAHKKLPFGTILKIKSVDTGKSVVVRINDRGPYIEGRDIDLSYGAAKALGIVDIGVAKVEIFKQDKSM